MEYLLVHRGGRGQSFEYELLFDGPVDGSLAGGTTGSSVPHISGLIAVPYDPAPLNPLRGYQREYEGWALAVGRSAHTVRSQVMAIRRFILWCDERGLMKPQDITRPILERYQRHLYHYRKKSGAPLSVTGQLGLLTPLQAWFKWLARGNHILWNPASDRKSPRRSRAGSWRRSTRAASGAWS